MVPPCFLFLRSVKVVHFCFASKRNGLLVFLTLCQQISGQKWGPAHKWTSLYFLLERAKNTRFNVNSNFICCKAIKSPVTHVCHSSELIFPSLFLSYLVLNCLSRYSKLRFGIPYFHSWNRSMLFCKDSLTENTLVCHLYCNYRKFSSALS